MAIFVAARRWLILGTIVWFDLIFILGICSPALGTSKVNSVGQIAFVSDRSGKADIYLINGDGSDLQRLTQNGKDNSAPTWSPDGKQLAFVSDGRICIIYVEAVQNTHCATSELEEDSFPTWSPNGRYIAYMNAFPRGPISLVDVQTSSIRRLAEFGLEWPLTWSPDGKRLAAMEKNSPNSMVVIDVDTGIVARTLIQFPQYTSFGYTLQWSPNGTDFAFFSTYFNYSRKTLYGQLSVINSQGADFHILARNVREVEGRPAWSPDSSQIAFYGDLATAGNINLYAINVDGSNLRQLTKDLFFIIDPSWSPDGKRIVFAADPIARNLYVIDSDGRNLRRLTSGGSSNGSAVWRPMPVVSK